MKILVCGSEGMVGSNVVRILESKYRGKVYTADLKHGVDLRDPRDCKLVTRNCDQIFHLADRTVGIGYSSTHHGQMMTDSLLISLNLLEAARKAGVKDYLYVSSSCVYEGDLGDDKIVFPYPPELSNAGYGWAKCIAERQCIYYAREYGMRTVIARPANIYGPSYDWTRPVEDMHVIPALIVKMLRKHKEITIWGSGNQTRTFQYESNAASLIVRLMENGQSGEAYNLGGLELPIRGVAAAIAVVCKYSGEIRFDESKPEGPSRKAQDFSKIEALLGPEYYCEDKPSLELTIAAARETLG